MFRALLVFATIITVYSQKCQQQFQNFHNNNTIVDQLTGTFYVVLTSSNKVFDCEKTNWTGTGNELEAIIQSPNCCRKAYNPIPNSGQLDFTVTPINYREGCPAANETVAFKMISTTGTDDNLCITITACQRERQGMYVMCRQQIVSQVVLDEISNSVKDLTPQIFKTNQENCIFPENNCPVKT